MKTRLLTCLVAASLSLTSASAQTTQTQKDMGQTMFYAPPTFTHPWQGKKIAYFGDSITDPRVKAKTNKWWALLSEWLNATSYCYAISGRQWNDIPRQTETLMKEHGQDVDAILIFMGTNDYNHAIPLGEWYDIDEQDVLYTRNKQQMTQHRKHRTPAMNDSTVRGRINIAMSQLKDLYPTKQIVILTPIHRAKFSSGPQNIQPDEMYPNSLGLWLDDYVNAIKETANVWAVPVIDLHSLSGLYPMSDSHARFFARPDGDRLHPNDEGYERIAKTLYYQLLTLPLF